MIKESIGKALLKVERIQGTDGKVEVTWKCMDDTAVNGKDYHGGTGTLLFEHGEQVKYIPIDIIDDKDFEKNETFIVELTGTSEGAHLGNIRSAVVTIMNDDGKLRKTALVYVEGITYLLWHCVRADLRLSAESNSRKPRVTLSTNAKQNQTN